jgi:putative redox protein
MSVHLQHKPGSKLAQTIHLRDHQFDTDVSASEGGGDEGPSPHDLYDAELSQLATVAEKCPVHKLMTSVTTEITTRVERAA